MKPQTIHEQLFFTTICVETVDPDKPGGGTAFVYQVPIGPNRHATFLVSNSHVVVGNGAIRLRFLLGDEADGSVSLGEVHHLTISDPESLFVRHPDPDIDVAVAPLSNIVSDIEAQGRYPFFRAVSPAMMLNRTSLRQLDALEQVTFLGYPSGLYDSVNYLPIARRGHTATLPSIDYEGRPTFLIDASVFPGSSGSPVLIAESSRQQRGTTQANSGRLILLGILSGVYERSIPVQGSTEGPPQIITDGLNIGLVYRASVIDEVVNAVLASHNLKRFPETSENDEPIGRVQAETDALVGQSDRS